MKKSASILTLFVLLLANVAFAQQDVGELLFRSILRMSQYPGSPFTGNIVNDLVMFFFIPTVFIIIVIYTLVQRITVHPKLNLLMSVAFYLFIVFGGYYGMFALLAGPYFLFLLIIMGLLFFFLGHFGLRRPQGGAGHPMSGAAVQGVELGSEGLKSLEHEYKELNKKFREIKSSFEKEWGDIQRLAEKGVDTRFASGVLAERQQELSKIRGRMTDIEIIFSKHNIHKDASASVSAFMRRYKM